MNQEPSVIKSNRNNWVFVVWRRRRWSRRRRHRTNFSGKVMDKAKISSRNNVSLWWRDDRRIEEEEDKGR